MTRTCAHPPAYLPDASSPVFVQCADGSVQAIRPTRGLGMFGGVPDDDCPVHGLEAQRRQDYEWRRSKVMDWREIRKAWPKARRDAAAAIGIDWWEYADPEGNYWRYHPKK